MQNWVMQEIVLPVVTLRRIGDVVEIVHNRLGVVTQVSEKRLENWAMSQLRKELLPQPVEDEA